jgi:hypothetical protein
MAGRAASALAAVALLATMAAVAPPASASAGPGWCLPPLFESGQRLQSMPFPTAFWLPPLLHQHQLCHAAREQPEQGRAILVGNSAVLGHPLPVEATLSGKLNERLASREVPGRVFNLGFVIPYQLRDALIMHAALEFRPDLIVYPLGLVEFTHQAPGVFGPNHAFFTANDTAVRELARTGLPGLSEPLQRYEAAYVKQGRAKGYWARLRDMGALAHAAARAHAQSLARWIDPTRVQEPVHRLQQANYDCSQTVKEEARTLQGWQSWNILEYLQQLHDAEGIAVLVVNWPVVHQPVGECYNIRYTAAGLDEFNRWLRAECEARGLGYIDLHDLLTPAQFVDSLHLTEEGHRRVADELAPAVETALRTQLADRQPPR